MAISEIQKEFYRDCREKKRTGSNIFSRKSTRKGGGLAFRSAYTFMSRKERKALNGEVTTMNVKQVMTIDAFKRLDAGMRKVALEYWLKDIGKKSEIAKQMGISSATLDYHIENAGLSHIIRRFPSKKDSEATKLKEKIGITTEEFKSLPRKDMQDIVAELLPSHSLNVISRALGISMTMMKTLQREIIVANGGEVEKPKAKRESKPVIVKSDNSIAGMIYDSLKSEPKEIEEVEEKQVELELEEKEIKEEISMNTLQPVEEKKEIVKEEPSVVVEKVYSQIFSLNGKFTGSQLKKRLEAIALFVEDEESFEIELAVKS